ncbi:MAG TPA: DUF3597 domain-containing protein [Allosphingosinicella sp.]
MSIFDTIKTAIFGWRPSAEEVARAQAQQQQAQTGAHGSGQVSAMPQVGQPQAAPTAAAAVDVEAMLTQKMHAKGDPDLNWRTSIVDLMKLLDLDPSLANRSELATELGYSGAKDGSAEMNIWLHREVMRKLAVSGGTVPAELQH